LVVVVALVALVATPAAADSLLLVTMLEPMPATVVVTTPLTPMALSLPLLRLVRTPGVPLWAAAVTTGKSSLIQLASAPDHPI
jgi:hypothetical protein